MGGFSLSFARAQQQQQLVHLYSLSLIGGSFCRYFAYYYYLIYPLFLLLFRSIICRFAFCFALIYFTCTHTHSHTHFSRSLSAFWSRQKRLETRHTHTHAEKEVCDFICYFSSRLCSFVICEFAACLSQTFICRRRPLSGRLCGGREGAVFEGGHKTRPENALCLCCLRLWLSLFLTCLLLLPCTGLLFTAL